MPWTIPTSSHFWPNWPTSRGHFHNISLELASLTFYQPIVEFKVNLMTFIFPTNSHFWSNPPTFGGGFCKPSLDLTSLTFCQCVVHLSGYSNYSLWTSSHERHICAYPPFLLSNAFFGATS